MIAACDAYEAMTSERCYREQRDHDGACEELRREAGHQFDPKVVEVLLDELHKHGVTPPASGKPCTAPAATDEVAAHLHEVLARHAVGPLEMHAR